MAKKYLLALTDDQAEIVGFALGVAKRRQIEAAREVPSQAVQGCLDRIARIEEVQYLLDSCPTTDATEP